MCTKERLYLEQNGKCFYCGEPLSLDEGTVEHLNPRANGGSNAIDNYVLTHRHSNELFADWPLKKKMAILMQYGGKLPKDLCRGEAMSARAHSVVAHVAEAANGQIGQGVSTQDDWTKAENTKLRHVTQSLLREGPLSKSAFFSLLYQVMPASKSLGAKRISKHLEDVVFFYEQQVALKTYTLAA